MSKIAIIAAAAIVAGSSTSTSTDFRVQQTGAVRLAVRANEPEVAAEEAEEKAAEEKKKLFAHFEAQGKDSEWVGKALFEATNEGKEFKNFMPRPWFFPSREAMDQWEAHKATWDSMAAKLKTIKEKAEKKSEDARAAKALEFPSKVVKNWKDKKAAAIKAAQDAQDAAIKAAQDARRLKMRDEEADRAHAIKIALIALSIIACPVLLVFLVHWCRSADDDDDDYDSEYESELEEDYGFDSEAEEVETHAKMSQLTVAEASMASTFARAKSSTRSAKSAASRGSQKKRVMRV